MSTHETVSQSDVVAVMRSERIVMLTTNTADGKLVAHR